MRVILLYICFLVLLSARTAYSYSFDYSKPCSLAYNHFWSLQLDKGKRELISEFKSNSGNLLATYISDYHDFLLYLFNGDPAFYEQHRKNFSARITLLDNGSDQSPWKRFCKANIYLHWAILYARNGDNFKAATTFRKSFVLLKENIQKFPDFSPNQLIYGVEEAIIGTIPEDYKWLAAVLGLKGNVRKGIDKVEKYIEGCDSASDFLYKEAVIYKLYLKFYLQSQREEVWAYVNSPQFPVQNNLFNCFVKANIALNYRKANVALQTLAYAASLADYRRFPAFDYEYGYALLYKLDWSAKDYFIRYIDNNTGKLFSKDAAQKLAYIYFLSNNSTYSSFYEKKILKIGNTLADADKQAQRFGNNPKYPNKTLLEVRLLIDGGYYQQALSKITATIEHDYTELADKMEYNFRLGRIYEELKDYNKAIYYYKITYTRGRYLPDYFAARAALQMGFIYEESGRKAEALQAYNDCLSLRNHDFQSSIDQQAKAGINRISAK